MLWVVWLTLHRFVQVDATEEPTLATKYDVSGYPTMKMFRKGRMYEYEGGREQNSEFLFQLLLVGFCRQDLLFQLFFRTSFYNLSCDWSHL